MKTLLNDRDRQRTQARIGTLRPDAERRWGRMNAHQMVCHLTDVYRAMLADGSAGSQPPKPPLFGRTVMKWVALYSPTPWPHGVRTSARVDQEKGGTRPTEFARDLAALTSTSDRFLHNLDAIARRPHFLFGNLSAAQWARWAYLHTDHHLRQFGL